MTATLEIGKLDLSEALNSQLGGKDKLELSSENVEQDLARLVLGLLEFLRQVMELRAIDRLEAGKLTPKQEEELGETLMRAEERIAEIAGKFGLSRQDLSLDLGPLGRTI